MSKLKIYTFPDQVLREKAKPIERVEKKLYKLADDMLETMYEAPGIGLAANQVGILDRILVLDTEYTVHDPDDEDAPRDGEIVDGRIVSGKKPMVIINPKIIYKEGKQVYAEGCLSVPEYSEEVERFDKIKVEYQDIDGLTKTLDAEGLLSVCIQHEMDHLEGKLFIDHLSQLKQDLVKKKLIRARKESEEDDEEF